MQNQIEDIKRHAPLLNRPLSAFMGQDVIDYLSRLTPLPATGCVAGQSVMSALLALYPSKKHLGHTGPIKDVDVFYGAQDRYTENGQFEILGVCQDANNIDSDVDSRINADEYKRVFEKRLNIENLHMVGLLNLIEMVPGASDSNKPLKNDIDRLDTVLSEFDFSLVQVGIDLKTRQMRWMPAFEEFVNGAPVQAQDIGLAERTWIRYQKKSEQMEWLSWDEKQIKSAVQLAQIRTYALLSGDDRIPKKTTGWEDLSDNSKIPPIWDWKQCVDQESSFLEVVRMEKDNKFSLTPTDKIFFDSFVAIYMPSTNADPNVIQVNSDDPTTDLNFSKDLLKGLLRNRRDSQMFMDYVAVGGSLLHGASHEEMRLGRRPCLIHDAIDWNKLDVVDMLLDKGFSPNDRDNGRNSPLGYTAYLKLSISSANFREKGEFGEKGDREKLDFIFTKMGVLGANVTLPVGLNSTVFHEMLKDSRSVLLIKEIAEHTAHRELINGFGKFPHEVLSKNELTSIHEKIEECYPSGENQSNRQKLVHFFTKTPIEERIQRMSEMLLDGCCSGNLGAVRDALAQGAPVNAGNKCSPLFTASFHGHVDIVEHLLKAGADHGARENNGKTALMISAHGNHIAVMKALLRSGAFLETEDKTGRTALAFAITKGNKESVDFLIDQGANVDMVFGSGMRLIENCAMQWRDQTPSIILSLSNALEKNINFQAMQEILISSKKSAEKYERKDNVAVIDSILAKMSMDQMLREFPPKLRHSC